MSLFDSIVSAVTGKSDAPGETNPLMNALGGLLNQNGGLQGLLGKFNSAGLGTTVSSWIGMGDNHPISPDQVQQALGSEQVNALAAKLGVDPSKASGFLAEYLPKIVDKLTPTGEIDPSVDHQQGLSALIPSLMKNLGI